MYIRSKRIKGHTYFYLVKSERHGKKVTQKFIRYLGKTGGARLSPLVEEARKYKSAEKFVKTQGQPLYHGTKNNIDKFDLSKVGSGEGTDVFGNNANIFGDGVYLTDNKDIADFYAHQVAKKQFIKSYTHTGILGSPEPVFAKNADKLAAKNKRVIEAYLQGEVLDAKTFRVDEQIKDILVDSFAEATGIKGKAYAKKFVDDTVTYYRANVGKIHKNRGEFMYVIDRVLGTSRSGLNKINDHLKTRGYAAIRYPSDPSFEGRTSNNYFVFDISKLQTKSQLTDFYNQVRQKMAG